MRTRTSIRLRARRTTRLGVLQIQLDWVFGIKGTGRRVKFRTWSAKVWPYSHNQTHFLIYVSHKNESHKNTLSQQRIIGWLGLFAGLSSTWLAKAWPAYLPAFFYTETRTRTHSLTYQRMMVAVCQIKFFTAVLDWVKLGLYVCLQENTYHQMTGTLRRIEFCTAVLDWPRLGLHARLRSQGLFAGLSAVLQMLDRQGFLFSYSHTCALSLLLRNIFITHNIHEFNVWTSSTT